MSWISEITTVSDLTLTSLQQNSLWLLIFQFYICFQETVKLSNSQNYRDNLFSYSYPELNKFLTGWNVIVTTQMAIHNPNNLDEMQKKV